MKMWVHWYPPLSGFSCLQSVWGSDCNFNWNFRLKGSIFMFALGANCNWDDKIVVITSLFILIFLNSFSVENSRCFIQYNGDPGLEPLYDLEMPDPETTHGESFWKFRVRIESVSFSWRVFQSDTCCWQHAVNSYINTHGLHC